MTAAPRILPALPWADYRALQAANFSALKYAAISPRHYRHALTAERTDTAATRTGRELHALLLGGEPDPMAAVVVYDKPRRGAPFEAFRAALPPGTTILSPGEHADLAKSTATARAMAAAVRAEPLAMVYLAAGEPELSLTWTHAPTGTAMKARLDWLTSRTAPTIAEVKSTRSIQERAFMADAERRLYFAQVGIYAAGVHAALGVWPEAVSIVVENVPPYDVAVYHIGDDVIAEGWATAEGWLATVAEAERTGVWHGVARGRMLEWTRPAWATGDVAVPEIAIDEVET